jgi:hypothetical protein
MIAAFGYSGSRPSQEDRCQEIHGQHRLDLGLGSGVQLLGAHATSVVNQDVEPAEGIERTLQGLSAPFRRADIRGDPGDPPPILRSSSTAVEWRPAITTLAPLAKKALAIAKPMPLEPPVTRMRFRSSFLVVVLTRRADSWTGKAHASSLRH